MWKGPQEDGITFSLLSRFLCCRERFRLYVVEGLRADEGFNHKIEYGQLWHEAEEAHSAGKPFRPAINAYMDRLRSKYPANEAEILKWGALCSLHFPVYVAHWKNSPIERQRQPIWEEKTFCVPYRLPNGAIVKLRGKWDCIFARNKSLYLQENKTKGEIDELGVTRSVHENLQTMIYQVALRTWKEIAYSCSGNTPPCFPFVEVHPTPNLPNMDALTGRKIAGTLYNIVRRPLSDRFAPRQRKGETAKAFYERVAAGIAKDPAHWFKRWDVTITDADVARFRQRVLDPILGQLCVWWESIKDDPFKPWETVEPYLMDDEGGLRTRRIPNPFHWQSPWGVYNSLASGWRGDYFDLLTTGSASGLVKVDTLFPELQG